MGSGGGEVRICLFNVVCRGEGLLHLIAVIYGTLGAGGPPRAELKLIAGRPPPNRGRPPSCVVNSAVLTEFFKEPGSRSLRGAEPRQSASSARRCRAEEEEESFRRSRRQNVRMGFSLWRVARTVFARRCMPWFPCNKALGSHNGSPCQPAADLVARCVRAADGPSASPGPRSAEAERRPPPRGRRGKKRKALSCPTDVRIISRSLNASSFSCDLCRRGAQAGARRRRFGGGVCVCVRVCV